jgi:ferredoxin
MLHFFVAIIVLTTIGEVTAFTTTKIATLRIRTLLRGKPVEVKFEPSGKTIIAEQGETIESVAKKAGVLIPFKCKQGRCNSCEVRLNGRVSAKACQGASIPGGPTKSLTVVVINKKPL